ncbi:MAG: DUF421 domain-containing protein [Negativicutes bacterium]|nr:DUF421 domain-containing protein [Negativicutes bacterium]
MAEILDIAIRTSVAYITLLFLTRFLGRREIAQLTFFDFISGITMGSVAASTLIDKMTSITAGVVALAVWSAWIFASNQLSIASVPARKMLEGEPVVVIHDGKILEHNLGKTHYSVHDVLTQLRSKNGVFDPSEVEVGVLEPNGELSILKKAAFQPLTPQSVAGQTSAPVSRYVGSELIVNGKILEDNLKQTGINREWLTQQLAMQGVDDISEIILASITPDGRLYVDKKADGGLSSHIE